MVDAQQLLCRLLTPKWVAYVCKLRAGKYMECVELYTFFVLCLN